MKVEIINILDRSGSMSSLRNDVIGGYNIYMADQRALPGQARATLVQFSDQIETLYEGVNIQHLGVLTQANYVTIGGTALADAIGMTLVKQGERIARDRWADKVIVNVFTDGEENASHEFTEQSAKQLIKQYEDEKGWTILFQGAGIDAFKTAGTFGVSAANTRAVQASAAGVAEAYGNMSFATTSLRTGT